MKKILLALCVLALVGCGGASDSLKCRESVVLMYPGAEIVSVPDHPYRFLVRKPNGSIVYVETLSILSPAVTMAFTAFDGK